MKIVLAHRETIEWQESAALVRSVFREEFGADIRAEPDCFVAYVNQSGRGEQAVEACAGISFFGQRPLLVEQYLDAPVEDVLTGVYGHTVLRGEILQMGSIASRQVTAGADILRALPLILAGMGRPYAVLTATARLAALMKRLGIVYHMLCEADGSRLGPDELARWGSYYQARPIVAYGKVSEQSEMLAGLMGRYAFDMVSIRSFSQRRRELSDAA